MMRHVPSRSQLYGVDLPGPFGLSGPARSPTVSANAGLNDATALWLVGRSAAVATPSRRYLRTATNKDAAQNIFNRFRHPPAATDPADTVALRPKAPFHGRCRRKKRLVVIIVCCTTL